MRQPLILSITPSPSLEGGAEQRYEPTEERRADSEDQTQDDVDDEDADQGDQTSTDRSTGIELERLAQRRDRRGEEPDEDDQSHDPAQNGDDPQHEEQLWRVREPDSAQHLPRRD